MCTLSELDSETVNNGTESKRMATLSKPFGAPTHHLRAAALHYLLKPRSRQAPPEGNAGLGAPVAIRAREGAMATIAEMYMKLLDLANDPRLGKHGPSPSKR